MSQTGAIPLEPRAGPRGAVARLIDTPRAVAGVHCAHCGSGDNGVTDSRPARLGSVRRRRKCNRCGFRWTTFEISDAVFGSIDDIIAMDERLRQLDRDDFDFVREFVAFLLKRREAGR